MTDLRVVIGNSSLARYQAGGGHWMVRLQYLLGLLALGHDVWLLELLWSTGDERADQDSIMSFFRRLQEFRLVNRCILLLFPKDQTEQDFDAAEVFGKSRAEAKEIIQSSDVLWNDCCGIRRPLLELFKWRMLVDLDPGHLQVSALTVDMDIFEHHAFWTVGSKLHHQNCQVPTLGLQWHTFLPFLYLPMWDVLSTGGPHQPFTSVTHWTWGALDFEGRLLSISKRDAYLQYVELPKEAKRPMQLAVHMPREWNLEDRDVLESHEWEIVDPWRVVQSPQDYQRYIATSCAEFMCPKPIFRDLKTGWFSDRSACYLASGRPVLAEDTGFSDILPMGKGLLAFRTEEEALRGIREIDQDFEGHSREARKIAEAYFSSDYWLRRMLS